MSIDKIISVRALIAGAHNGTDAKCILIHTGEKPAWVAFREGRGWLIYERSSVCVWHALDYTHDYACLMGVAVRAFYEFEGATIHVYNHFRDDWKRAVGGCENG